MNAGLDRSNIHYEVCLRSKNPYGEILKRLRSTDGAKLIYRSSNSSAESLALKLQQDGLLSLPYHSGLSRDQQTTNRTQFLNNQVQVLVTTNFAGGDIYKSDIRLVIHHELPPNIYRYFQQTGKAGRDGRPAHCSLFFSYQDVRRIIRSTERRTDISPREQEEIYQELGQFIDFVVSSECRLSLLPNQPKVHCGKCDNCSTSQPNLDWTVDAQKFLSCVARFSQRKESFGVGYTIDVLRGSEEKVSRYEHRKLSTYGIGKSKSEEEWKILAQFLLFHKLMEEVETGNYNYTVLKLNSKSWEIMRKQRSVLVSSATWRAPSTYTPRQTGNRIDTVQLYQQGFTVAEIAQKQNLQEQTILHRLAKSIMSGELGTIDLNVHISKDGQLEILEALKGIGCETLKPAYDHLDGRYSCGHIHLVRATWQKFGTLPETIESVRIDDPSDDYEEDIHDYASDHYLDYDPSVDLGYLDDIENPDVY